MKKNTWIGWFAIVFGSAAVQAQLIAELFSPDTVSKTTSTTEPPEQLVRACGLFRRHNNDNPCQPCNKDDLDLIDGTLDSPDCMCQKCTEPYDFLVECPYCSKCSDENNFCLDFIEGVGFNVGDDAVLSVLTARISTTGADSAKNTIFFERIPRENSYDCRIRLNGVLCNSCSITGCLDIDCRNVKNGGGRWTCEDAEDMVSDTSHPLHALVDPKGFCDQDED